MVPNMDEVVADSEDELSLFEEEPRNSEWIHIILISQLIAANKRVPNLT